PWFGLGRSTETRGEYSELNPELNSRTHHGLHQPHLHLLFSSNCSVSELPPALQSSDPDAGHAELFVLWLGKSALVGAAVHQHFRRLFLWAGSGQIFRASYGWPGPSVVAQRPAP